MSLPPNAEQRPHPAPASRSRTRLRISLWGGNAQALANALHAHAIAQAGWMERMEVSVHIPEFAQTETEAPRGMADWRHWLASELMLCGTPHLSLLVPTDAPAAQPGEWLLRTALSEAGMAYQVLYGAGAEDQLRNATNAIALTAKGVLPSSENACFQIRESQQEQRMRMRAWNCEKCSDPECEHRLFTGLRDAASKPQQAPVTL